MKLEKGSSALFVVALVVFRDSREAQRCDEALTAYRRDSSLRDDFEFHFARNSSRQRHGFLATISAFQFETHVFALNKPSLTAEELQQLDSVSKWAARAAFDEVRLRLRDARVVIDGSGDRQFRRELIAYLRKGVETQSGVRAIHSLKLQAADRSNLLQVADYVASVSARLSLARLTANAFERPTSHGRKLHSEFGQPSTSGTKNGPVPSLFRHAPHEEDCSGTDPVHCQIKRLCSGPSIDALPATLLV